MRFDAKTLQPYLNTAVQAAADAVKPLVGCGDKIKIDTVAVAALRDSLNCAPISGTIIVGEGEADGSAFLYNGEKVGAGGMEIDIAVDPIDGTTNAANGTLNAVSILGASPKGTMISSPDIKMQKLILRPGIDPTNIDMLEGWAPTLRKIAERINKPVNELRVCCYTNARYPRVLNRDATVIPTLLDLGITPMHVPNEWPQIPELCDGNIDLMLGIGGAPEAIIATAALVAAGGHIQGQFYADDMTKYPNLDIKTVHHTQDIIKAEQAVFAMAEITPLIPLPFK